MSRLISLLLASLTVYGAVDYGGHPTACQSRPCVYKITCSGSPRLGTVADIQAAVNNAHRGDTIQLEAGCTWKGLPDAVWIDRDPPGSSGRVLITTTEMDKLPAPGTRITRAYWPLLPRLELVSYNGPFFSVASGFDGSSGRTPGVAARGWEFRGLGFWVDVQDPLSSTDITNSFLRVGASGASRSKAGNNFTSLVVSGGVATVTVASTVHSLLSGDKIRVSGITQPLAALNGVQTITERIDAWRFRFNAPGVPDGDYTQPTMYYSFPADSSQLPEDIVIAQCIFDQGGLSKVRRDLLLNSGTTVVRDSWISAARSVGGDSQHILALAGKGNWTIENNYISGAASENIMFGGDANHLGTPVTGIDIRYNYMAHIPEIARTRNWRLMKSDGLPVLKGRVVRPTVKNGWYYIAMNMGVPGDVEPDWSTCLLPGCSITDGTVVWRRFYGDNLNAWTIKNNFEIKSARDVTLSHNVLEYMWFAGQDRAINIKSEQQSLYPGYGNNCVPTLAGTVNTNGTEVTAVSGVFPWQVNTRADNGVDPMTIRIGGITYRVASFDTASKLTLTTSAGQQNNVPFQYGADPAVRFCQAAETRNVTLTHNIVRNTLSPFVLNPGTNANRALTGGFLLRHNLFEKNDPKIWSSEDGLPYHNDAVTAHLYFAPLVARFVMDHNTVTGSNTAWGFFADNWQSTNPKDSVLTNNIFDKNLVGFFRSTEHFELARELCGGATCGTAQWDRNILIGTNIASYAASPGAVGNLCPTKTSCATPDYSMLFDSKDSGYLQVRPGSAFTRKATDGADYGADFSQLPEIRDVVVRPTDRMVLFRFRVTEPIADIPCVAEVSTTPDYSTYSGELAHISEWSGQDSDSADRFPRSGYDRVIVVGHSVALTSSTLHYYRLHCGGDVRTGTFTTDKEYGGTEARTLNFEAGSETEVLKWGYGYSRSSDDIPDGVNVPASCTAGKPCTIPYEPERGRVIYWRLGNGPVSVEAVR